MLLSTISLRELLKYFSRHDSNQSLLLLLNITRITTMKIFLVVLVLLALVSSQELQVLSETSLAEELASGKHIWLVYRSRTSDFILEAQ